MYVFLLLLIIFLIVFGTIKALVAHARNKEQENDIRDIMWRAEHKDGPGKPEQKSPYAPSREKDNLKSAKKMIIGGSVAVLIGTGLAIYGQNLNNNINAARAFEHFWNTSEIVYNPGDPFLTVGWVILGVGALLLVGGVAWLIIAKNKKDS